LAVKIVKKYSIQVNFATSSAHRSVVVGGNFYSIAVFAFKNRIADILQINVKSSTRSLIKSHKVNSQ